MLPDDRSALAIEVATLRRSIRHAHALAATALLASLILVASAFQSSKPRVVEADRLVLRGPAGTAVLTVDRAQLAVHLAASRIVPGSGFALGPADLDSVLLLPPTLTLRNSPDAELVLHGLRGVETARLGGPMVRRLQQSP